MRFNCTSKCTLHDLIIQEMLRSKKQGNTTQQKDKATQHNLPKAVIFQRKNSCLRWDIYTDVLYTCTCSCNLPRSVFGPARSLPNFWSLIVSRSGGSKISVESTPDVEETLVVYKEKHVYSTLGRFQKGNHHTGRTTNVNKSRTPDAQP